MTEQENLKKEEPKLNVVPCLIIDLGTKFVRFGISSNNTPSTIVKTNHPNLHQKCTKPNEPALTFGRITNKEKIGTILSYARSTVKEQTIGESVMVIDTLFTPRNDRSYIAEYLFNTLHAQRIFFLRQPIVSLYQTRSDTGLVVHISTTISIVPIYKGRVLFQAINKQNFGSDQVMQYLMDLLEKQGNDLNDLGSDPLQVVSNLLKQFGSVSLDIMKEPLQKKKAIKINRKTTNTQETTVVKLTARNEFCECNEALFEPSRIGLNTPGLSDLIESSILKSPLLTREEIMKNIVLAGGFAETKGLPERIQSDLEKRFTDFSISPEISESKITKNSEWIGANIVANKDLDIKDWISKEEWEKNPQQIIKEKCF
ncbi:actin cytoskeletal 2a [Anaeramoeba flamelloides]|uniref:Actin cytoskeletal 2a n=1 Tax=Anaeramoeba flamelloides TaxID=1746091 RepID=A0AAV8A7E3_9EUKA|nr:actin cytoskeletal 2a [Anaeramoeba flamelloides]